MNSTSRSYLAVNYILAGIVVVILLYSGVFSPVKDNYPVQCVHQLITGKPCPSCGLSHSFSLIVRGEFREAREWNIYGMRVFLFFIFQLAMRLSVSLFIHRRGSHTRSLAKFDIIISVIAFIFCFRQFMAYYATLLF